METSPAKLRGCMWRHMFMSGVEMGSCRTVGARNGSCLVVILRRHDDFLSCNTQPEASRGFNQPPSGCPNSKRFHKPFIVVESHSSAETIPFTAPNIGTSVRGFDHWDLFTWCNHSIVADDVRRYWPQLSGGPATLRPKPSGAQGGAFWCLWNGD